MAQAIVLNGEDLSVTDVWRVAAEGAAVTLDESCRERVDASRRVLEDLVARDQVVYGVTTGVGPLCDRLLPREDAEALQHNLVRALSAGRCRSRHRSRS